MTIPTEFILDYKKGNFVDEGELKIKNQCKPKGLKKLFTKNHILRLEVNARILDRDYKKGIGLDTLDQLLDNLNIKCGMKISPDFVKYSKVSKIHVKDDVDVRPDRLMDELMLVGHWSRYQRVRRENSVSYEYLTKGDKMTTTVYGKLVHMMRFSEDYKGLGIDFGEFRGVTRIETKFDDWRTVKTRFNTRNLEYILKQNNINYIAMNNILKNQPTQINKTDLSRFKSLTEYKHYTMAKDLNERYNGDLTAIKAFIRSHTSRPKHYYDKIDEFLPMVKAPQGTELNVIRMTKEQLKA
ncbi:hypothetical protein ACOKFD_16300 [Flagellimonas sp. S174]|uniref:hypothetical protein n=1 Tax=Flagellimonas sp. S174 TaxID=3410790 RepID=UPI003BF5F9D6